MARPKEYNERHIASADAARARILAQYRWLENLIETGRQIPAGDALIRWLSDFDRWTRDLGRKIAAASEVPELAPDARNLAEALGGVPAEWVRQHDQARMLLDTARKMRSLEAPEFTPEFRDRRMLLAVIAVQQVERDGRKLTPLQLVLLEVASGVSEPTEGPSEPEYARRQVAARERLRRARRWVAQRGTPVPPDPNSPKMPAKIR